MADYDDRSDSPWPATSSLLSMVGWFVIVTSAAWAGYSLWAIGQAQAGAPDVMSVFAGLGIGLAVALICWGLSAMLVRLDGLQRAITSLGAARSDVGGARRDVEISQGDELVLLLREVRDISLLSDQQRQMRLHALGQAAISVLQRDVPQLLREHNWIEARRRVQEARERYPMLAEWDAFERQIEQMRTQVEAQDIENAERQVADLEALGAWDRVSEVCNDLLHRHPTSQRANALAQRVRSQRSTVEAEQRAKLMAQAQEATNSRDWRAALTAATALIQRFPRTAEAAALMQQLPLLRENAEIQARQVLEHEYRENVKHHRFEDALRVAHDLINQYPGSKQAEILREQLPKLEEMAHAVPRA